MAKLNLSPPWVVYYRKLSAFFKEDSEVRITYDDIEQEIKLYVDNAEKAVALEKLLPKEQNFGNVTLYITIVPANQTTFDSVKVAYSTNSSDIIHICFNFDIYFYFLYFFFHFHKFFYFITNIY